MRIQYVSDLHLEHYKIYTAEQLNPLQWIKPDPTADLLVLAGDIGNPFRASYSLFLQWCSENWPQVVIVAGNHEFYRMITTGNHATYEGGKSKEEVIELIRKIVGHFPNVKFLERERLTVSPGLHVLGCTLWSYVPEDMHKYAAAGLNDFRLIPGASVPAYNAWHARDLAWLEAELREIAAAGERAIVVTHHLPTSQLVSEQYQDHPLNCCFTTNLEELIKETKPAAWICGHTHLGNRATIGGTQLAVNPWGYPGERVPTRNREAILDITSSVVAPSSTHFAEQ